jgi:hypothetical protein
MVVMVPDAGEICFYLLVYDCNELGQKRIGQRRCSEDQERSHSPFYKAVSIESLNWPSMTEA